MSKPLIQPSHDATATALAIAYQIVEHDVVDRDATAKAELIGELVRVMVDPNPQRTYQRQVQQEQQQQG